ncbi:transmembrane protein 167 precursor [Nannochloropsis gaditana]|uniref:Transmembrane protein 167 n=2 Tax=Nannochloropsis gaditana TaxID=72520 RepID=W7TJ60_9STRA|nr:transmembrane protein 167 precursor [Nannochloropsis gaditana]
MILFVRTFDVKTAPKRIFEGELGVSFCNRLVRCMCGQTLRKATCLIVRPRTKWRQPSAEKNTHRRGQLVRLVWDIMSAIFDFSSLITVVLLFIVTCTYLRGFRSTIFDNAPSADGAINRHEGLLGFCWKASRIGERKSEWVGLACVGMAVHVLFFKKN